MSDILYSNHTQGCHRQVETYMAEVEEVLSHWLVEAEGSRKNTITVCQLKHIPQ